MNMLSYKDYMGTVEYSAEDHCLYGQIAFIRDLVNYEAVNVEDLEAAFYEAVDEYLADCEARGVAPNQSLKGSFNVRTGEELHRSAVIAKGDASLNSFVCDAIREKIARVLN